MKLYSGFLFLILTLSSSIALSSESLTGIWQNESKQNDYYSIHQSDDGTLILIYLLKLEFSGTVLSATYFGSIGNPILKQLELGKDSEEIFNYDLKVDFINHNEATIQPVVSDRSVFNPFHIKIKKIIGSN